MSEAFGFEEYNEEYKSTIKIQDINSFRTLSTVPRLIYTYNWKDLRPEYRFSQVNQRKVPKLVVQEMKVFPGLTPTGGEYLEKIEAKVKDGNTVYECMIHDFPTLCGYEDNVRSESVVCTCQGRNTHIFYYDPRRHCDHSYAVMKAFEEKYGKVPVLESEISYKKRSAILLTDLYKKFLAKQRETFSTEYRRLDEVDFLKDLLEQKSIISFFDFSTVVKSGVTTDEAIYRARQIINQEFDGDYPVLHRKFKIEHFYSFIGNELYLKQTGNIEGETPVYPYTEFLGDFANFYTQKNFELGISYSQKNELLGYAKPNCNKDAAGVQIYDDTELVLLYEALNFIAQNDPPLRDRYVSNKVSNFLQTTEHNSFVEDFRQESSAKRTPSIFIKPQLIYEDQNLFCCFRVGEGKGKGLIIRDFPAFAHYYAERQFYYISKTNGIDFDLKDFDDHSKQYFDFISQKLRQTQLAVLSYKNIANGSTPLILDYHIVLQGLFLDDFYAIAQSDEIELQYKGSVRSNSVVKVGDCPTYFEINVAPFLDLNNNFLGLKVNGTAPILICGGRDNFYALTEHYLTKISRSDFTSLMPFADMASNYKYDLTIVKDEVNQFYCRILPKYLKNPIFSVVVENEKLIEDNLAVEPTFKFYALLPSEGMNENTQRYNVTIEASADYNGTTVPLNQVGGGINNRDFNYEKSIEKRASWVLDKFAKLDNRYTASLPGDDFCDFINSTIGELQRFGEVTTNVDLDNYKVISELPIKLNVTVDKSNLLDISITSDRFNVEELELLLKSYALKRKWCRLSDNSFVKLEDSQVMEDIYNLLGAVDLQAVEVLHNKAKIPLFRALYLDKLIGEHDSLLYLRDQNYRRLIRNFKNIGESDYEVPQSLSKVLREYQIYGYKWLQSLSHAGFGGILADDMGLGKTLQVISILEAQIEDRTGDTKQPLSLVVAPASLVYQWIDEVERFSKRIKAVAISGTATVRKELLSNTDGVNLMVISYESLSRDVTLMRDLVFDMLIIDEAQKIKNHKAGFTKAVKGLKASIRLALTGTPIENRLTELWSIFDFIMPGFLYGYTEFVRRFETPIAKGHDASATAKLKSMTGPFILRRKKQDVLKDLPSKMEEVVYSKIQGEQQKLYDAQVLKMKEIIKVDDGKGKIEILAELMRIREICCDPALVFENYQSGSAKKDACMDLLETAIDGGHRCLVFSQFTSMLALLEVELQNREIPYYKITGETPKDKRVALVNKFNNDQTPVFLISLKAGGVGLNLIGADTVIHYDPWWNLAAQNQATDRAHRIGQTKNVTVYKLILKNTIEERILNLQRTKKDLADAILEGEQKSLMSLSSEELLNLLS